MIVSRLRAALDLDIYPLMKFIRPRCAERAKPGRGASAHYAYWLFRLFSRHISRTQLFQQNHHISFLALVALKLMVSLISRLVSCSARIVVDRQTDRQTHRPSTVTLTAHARRGLMRDERRKEEKASKVKQTTRQSNTAHPRQSLFLR